ncbi:MAG: hypothetical protein R3C56_26685 [Pirellulaceae bacterium]
MLQVLAGEQEMAPQPDALRDPVGDGPAERLPGLLHKYDRRVLMITTGACAIHCRYCFRRHYPCDTAPTRSRGLGPIPTEHCRRPVADEANPAAVTPPTPGRQLFGLARHTNWCQGHIFGGYESTHASSSLFRTRLQQNCSTGSANRR